MKTRSKQRIVNEMEHASLVAGSEEGHWVWTLSMLDRLGHVRLRAHAPYLLVYADGLDTQCWGQYWLISHKRYWLLQGCPGLSWAM